MSGHALPIAGAVAVLVLLATVPQLGLFALVLAMVGAVLGWLLRRDSRACPRCGHRVPNGELDCPHCAYDFREIGRSA